MSGGVNVSGSVFSNGCPLPVLTNRQGGSSTVLKTAGTTNYSLSGANIITQVGMVDISFSSLAQYGNAVATITFPTAFSQTPLVFCTLNDGYAANQFTMSCYSISSTGVSFAALSVYNGSLTGSVHVAWIAIGM